MKYPNCPGHICSIIDWEIGEAYRKWGIGCNTEKELLKMIENKWLLEMCSDKNDIYFYVGNHNRFRDTFMILGTFYPSKKDNQLEIFPELGV